MDYIRTFIKVHGIVQGVGFRPFIYRIALEENLNGWVNNNSEGVYIDIEGQKSSVDSFIKKLNTCAPPLSNIENILIEKKTLKNYKKFSIKPSEKSNNNITLISPDIAVCEDCLKDIRNINNHRYKYPFTNCTNCGPRFSIIKSLPYDRDKTTMNSFEMCENCSDEYSNPLNRRFHAQPNACAECGPHVWVEDCHGKVISTDAPIKFAQEMLLKGKILAIKGLTGFHLACNALDKKAVSSLRLRKNRPDKPFAIMMKSLDTINNYCHVNSYEEELLTGKEKPIVILNKKNRENFSCSHKLSLPELPSNIAQNVNTLGIMMPYTPLHEILFMNNNISALVMTSANISTLPLEYKNEYAKKHLDKIADYFLLHNRDIHIPLDDSIVKIVDKDFFIIRKARGYTPSPIKSKETNIENGILALGPNMKNTFSFSKENFVFTSQYNGDLESLQNIELFQNNLTHFENIFSFSPKHIVHDMHPEYYTTKFAENLDLPTTSVQHHHAHIASCMVDNHIKAETVIGLAFDGTGFGIDSCIWGSEFIICNLNSFNRCAHLSYMPLVGGDSSIKSPWKIGASYVYTALKENKNTLHSSQNFESSKEYALKSLINMFGKESKVIANMIDKNLHTVQTSSMGRLFDAVSSMLNIRKHISYEGQASIELEAVLNKNIHDSYTFKVFVEDERYIIDTSDLICKIFEDILAEKKASYISAKFHNTIIEISVHICCVIRNKTSINKVCLSGGVFQNNYLTTRLKKNLKDNNFEVFVHKNIPTNDSGISVGQLYIADSILSNRENQ